MTSMERLEKVAAQVTGLADVSREAVVLRGFEKAVARCRQLEGELDGAFEALASAISAGEKDNLSLTGVLRMTKPMESAWATWTNDRTAIERSGFDPERFESARPKEVGAWPMRSES